MKKFLVLLIAMITISSCKSSIYGGKLTVAKYDKRHNFYVLKGKKHFPWEQNRVYWKTDRHYSIGDTIIIH